MVAFLNHGPQSPEPTPVAEPSPQGIVPGRVSVLIVTMNRPDDVPTAVRSVQKQDHGDVELVVVENGSRAEVVEANASLLADIPRARHVVLASNVGIPAGRNVAIGASSGEICVSLDDDAEFADPDALEAITGFLSERDDIGVVALRITDAAGDVRRWEYPFKSKTRDDRQSGPCGWFIGAGHAFRRSDIDRVGRFTDFGTLYAEDEQPVALRMLDAGLGLWFLGDTTVIHHRTPTARISSIWRRGGGHLANKIKVPLIYLPWTSVVTFVLLRTPHFMFVYRDPRVALAAAYYLVRDRRQVLGQRRPVSKSTLRTLSRIGGHRWY